MRTPITYYGGKQRIAPEIISMMPAHKIYVEPFFGGGAVFFRKQKTGIEVINDHNNDLINFYFCVQNRFPELQELIQQTLHSETMYYHAKDIWNGRVEANDIEKAWAIWLITNGSYAGSMHGGWKWCNGTTGGHTGTFIKYKREEFTERLHQRLDNVQISCRDALRVIQDRDTPETLFYLDPPYPGCVQQHYSGYTLEHLEELLRLLETIQGKFILSNYWSDLLKDYTGKNSWNYREIEVDLRITNLGRGTRKKETQFRTEVLIYNYTIQKGLFDN
ncbi:MAG: DNA adenine methylase [Dysgonamonadaceae bacterium]|jgi:DNA adenine methylase|nr:DNA adenine methylase [Dysgonamonadaceae bacterium]